MPTSELMMMIFAIDNNHDCSYLLIFATICLSLQCVIYLTFCSKLEWFFFLTINDSKWGVRTNAGFLKSKFIKLIKYYYYLVIIVRLTILINMEKNPAGISIVKLEKLQPPQNFTMQIFVQFEVFQNVYNEAKMPLIAPFLEIVFCLL